MTINVNEAEGVVLDWLVAKAAGFTPYSHRGQLYPHYVDDRDACASWSPTTNWNQAGPIIERERLDGFWNPELGKWSIAGWDSRAEREVVERHESLLVASMRCFAVSKLGNQAEVPEELCQN